jgi:PHP family Zn ribbon phosphoesterase
VTNGYEIPTCQKCETEYSLREGCEPSDYCDECAQTVAKDLREALEDIAEPMKKIQEDAKATGCRVNGAMANELCQDANWLRDKARAALRKIRN